MKRSFAILLALFAILPLCVCFASAETTQTADGLNVFRGSGMLVVYNSEYGDTTGTNEWGYEAVIENDKCVSLGGGNNKIPESGFVISGHDEDTGGKQMGMWIKNNIKKGDYVYFDKNTLTITVSNRPIESSAFYSVETTYNGINVTRAENFLVIYNNQGTTTKTNEFGYEVVVTNNYVTSLGGNNNLVPTGAGSFVVSGHGTSIDWLRRNVKIGMFVTYVASEKKIKFEFNADSLAKSLETSVAKAEKLIADAKENYLLIDYASADSKLASLKSEIENTKNAHKGGKDPEGYAKETEAIIEKLEALSDEICESKTVEYRGVWLRPTQTSAQAVDDYVETLYNAGINNICIETIYDSCMIMPMPENSYFNVNPKFKSFDLLQSYIDSCHKRGMELHCWMPVFYVGDAASANYRYSVGKQKPEWLSISSNGKSTEDANGFAMLDPANPEVQDFLLLTYKYILEKYDIDGFHLDYIRYYSNAESNCDWGYSEIAKNAFKEKFGVVPQYDLQASYWNDWVKFRCDYVTSFVARVRKLFDEVKPDCLLGADVAADPSDGYKYIYQDYYSWLDSGWLDIVFPMSYGVGYEDEIKEQTARCGDKAFISVGLGIFMEEMDASIMRDQVYYDTSVGTTGSCFFEASAYLAKKCGDTLLKSVYREKALAPNFDIKASFEAYLDTADKRVKEIILPLGGMDEANAKTVSEAIRTLKQNGFSVENYNACAKAVASAEMSDNAREAILKDINAAAKLYLVSDKTIELGDVSDTPVESEPETSDASDASEEASAEEHGEKKNYTPVIIGCIAAALAAVIAAAVVIIKKKGK